MPQRYPLIKVAAQNPEKQRLNKIVHVEPVYLLPVLPEATDTRLRVGGLCESKSLFEPYFCILRALARENNLFQNFVPDAPYFVQLPVFIQIKSSLVAKNG
jgi:hypothetical protein